MRLLRSLVWIAVPALAAGMRSGPEQVSIGSMAPPLKVSRWVKGSPIPALEKGKVYVVEFWATWCGPCRETIPHLSEMAKKYQGKATFIGVDVWESGEAASVDKAVEKFVTSMGDRMAYAVARDSANNDMAQTWMAAANQKGIPTAFIVNAQGQIAWIGHPMMDGMDKVLEDVITGKHDLAKAKTGEAKNEARAKYIEETDRLLKPLANLEIAGDYTKLLEKAEQAETEHPEFRKMIVPFKFMAYVHLEPERAKTMLSPEGSAWGDRLFLATILEMRQGLDPHWYAAVAAVYEEGLKRPQAPSRLYEPYARALHKAGRNQEAVAAQEKWLSLARGKEPEDSIKEYEANLKIYQEAAKPKPVTRD